MVVASVMLWLLFVYFWFYGTVQKSFTPMVSTVQNEVVSPEHVNSKDKLKLLFTEFEQSKEIITYSFVNKDKSVSYAEGLRKRDNILWWLNVIYPVKAGDTIIGWIKVWPSPEIVAGFLFSEKNILILFISFLCSILLVFCLTAAYVLFRFLVPLSEFRSVIKNIADGTASDIKIKYKSGLWKNMYESVFKLNSKVADVNTTIQMLFSVSKALTSKVDMNNIFNVVMNIIQKKFPDSMCAIILPAEDGSLRITAKLGYSQGFSRSIKIAEGNPVADAFVTSKMTIVKNINLIDQKFVKEFVSEGALTQINVPLIDEDNTALGILNVSGKTDNIFEIDTTDTIAIIGKYLSIALRNAKMYDKVQELNKKLETEVNTTSNELIQTNAKLIRKVRDIKTLSDISAFASAKFDLGEIIPFVIQKIMELTGMETSAVLIEDPVTKQFSFLKGSFSLDLEQLSAVKFSAENSGVIKNIKKNKKTAVFSNAAAIKKEASEFSSIVSMSSAIFAPIESVGEVTGVLVSINKFGNEISDNDVNIIQHIAVLFDGILSKVKLYSELEKKVSKLTFLQRVSSAIAATPNLEKTLEKIIDVTKEAFKADLCAVLLYDEKTNLLVTQKGAFFPGGIEKIMLKIAKDDENSLSAKIFREGIPYLSADATADTSIRSHSAKEWGIKSIIIVPLISDGKVIGVLRVGKQEPDFYSEEDKNLIIMIASQAAKLIENANLYSELAARKM